MNSDSYYDYNTDSYLYVNDDELTDFSDYWYDDDIWDTSNIVTIDNGIKSTVYIMKCVQDISRYLCACKSYHHGPIYECQQTVTPQHSKGICLSVQFICTVTIHSDFD